MSTQEQMTIDERYKYLRVMQSRYLKADRTAHSVLLDEMEQVTGLHRKSLVRLLAGDLTRQRGGATGDDGLHGFALLVRQRVLPPIGLAKLAEDIRYFEGAFGGAHGDKGLQEHSSSILDEGAPGNQS